jgi:hypothetical protein
MPRVNTRQGAALAAQRVPFTTHGSLSGVAGTSGTFGYLPADARNLYGDRANHITFTVLPYATPIAWHDDALGWIFPAARYSVTTSKQQGAVRAALGQYVTV